MVEELADKIKKGIAILTTTGIIFSFVGCENINFKIKNQRIISVKDRVIELVLDDISAYTELDNNVAMLNYEGNSFLQIIDSYNMARENENYVACQDYLYQLCYLILMESVSEVLDIDIKKITSLGVSWDEYDNYNILIKYLDVENLIIEKSFYLSGDGIGMAEIIKNYLMDKDMSPEEIDENYIRCVNFLLTTGYIVNETMVFSYSDDKVKVYIKN